MEVVAIVGTGRMGGVLARKLSKNYSLILVDKDIRRCGLLAQELGTLGTGEYSILSEADFIIMALPATAMKDALEKIKPFLKKEHILINISTDTGREMFDSVKESCRIISAKIIGHALSINSGELPLILISGEDEIALRRSAKIFGNIGVVNFGHENIVREINSIASFEGIKAAYNIQKKLRKLNIPDDYISFAIRNVACGTMNAFALQDMGPFAQEIIKRLDENQD